MDVAASDYQGKRPDLFTRGCRNPIDRNKLAPFSPLFNKTSGLYTSLDLVAGVVQYDDLLIAFGCLYLIRQRRENLPHGFDILVAQGALIFFCAGLRSILGQLEFEVSRGLISAFGTELSSHL